MDTSMSQRVFTYSALEDSPPDPQVLKKSGGRERMRIMVAAWTERLSRVLILASNSSCTDPNSRAPALAQSRKPPRRQQNPHASAGPQQVLQPLLQVPDALGDLPEGHVIEFQNLLHGVLGGPAAVSGLGARHRPATWNSAPGRTSSSRCRRC